MYNSYMYILANEGIDTLNSYGFKGRVSTIYIHRKGGNVFVH